MSSSTLSPTFDAATFEQFLKLSSGTTWLEQLRRESWERYTSMAWPSRSDEDWMRSDLRPFQLQRYSLPLEASQESIALPCWLTEGVELAGRLETIDSHVRRCEVSTAASSKGILFGSLESMSVQHPEIVQKYLYSVLDAKQDRFAALHAACWQGGHLLYVPKGVVVREPFHVLAGMSDGGTDLGHTLIVLEDGAEATFLYEANSPNAEAGGFHCGGVEIVLQPNARLRYVNLQDWGRNAWHFAHQRAKLMRDSSLQWTIAALGSRFAQVSQQVALCGTGAESQVNGVMFTQDRQQMTYNTIQHHRAEHCRSDFLYKAALQDRSRTVWRGMIKVDTAAQKTDGYQRNDNLLLSDQCRADSIPGLEIKADDVRCTHGSTSGKVDEELIFYARSRGFTRKEAIRMIVTGFFQQIFDRINIESVRDALGLAIARQVREYQ
jgi:Fe-S cluster assembly protein SufD